MHYLNFAHLNHNQLIEIIATSCGLINIYLITRQSNWNFLFGFINAGCFFLLFHHKKIYADMGLHAIYMAFQVYGYYQWRLGGQTHHGVRVKNASAKELGLAGLAALSLALLLAYILSHHTDSTQIPLDASSTAVCLVAQWMMSKKWLQNWWLWIGADIVSIVMYLNKALYVTAGLYGIYIVICFVGLAKWHQQLKRQNHPT